MAVIARAFARLRRHWVSVLWISMALLASVAQAASYVYDANGRLRAVTSSTGETSQYTYDALGNILAVDRIAAGQLSIAAFLPNHGPVGSTVTIYGQGFSTTPSNNTVKFNGVTGTVTSATANQLVATVPATATTGTISVTVGSSTATSVDCF
jgi:YD repeat-containing protein